MMLVPLQPAELIAYRNDLLDSFKHLATTPD